MARRSSTRLVGNDADRAAGARLIAIDDGPMANEMNAPDELPHAAAKERERLATQLRELEDFVAKSATAGEPLPPEALEMVARLREIVNALEALTASLDEE